MPPSWIERNRRWLLRTAPLLPIAAIVAAGLPFGGWRTLPDMLISTDPVTLLPGMRLALEPMSSMVPRWLVTAAFAAIIGTVTWAWRAGTPGFGFFAATAAFWLSLMIEVARWFKPGELPDFRDPLLAAMVAASTWRLLRYLPDQPVTPLPRRGACATRRRVLIGFLAGVSGLAIAAGAAALGPVIDLYGYAPEQVAEHVEGLPEGRTGASLVVSSAVTEIFGITGLDRWLKASTRLDRPDDLPLPGWAGAGEAHDGVLPAGRLRSVTTIETFRQAIDSAEPGDVILLHPGVYRVQGNYIQFARPGTAAS